MSGADYARVLVIVPTYNEKENLAALCEQVLAQLPGAHMLVVDDNSPDGTGALADQIAEGSAGRVHVLHRVQKEGLGKAYVAGFRWGLPRDYEYFVEMDADFSHDPAYLPTLIGRARDGADLVIGSRNIAGGGTRNWTLGRTLISRGGSLYSRTILGVGVKDLTGGFKCFRRRVLETLDLDGVQSAGFSFQVEMTYRAIRRGFRVEEIPIVFVDRRLGKSKMSRKIFLEALWMVWRLRLSGIK